MDILMPLYKPMFCLYHKNCVQFCSPHPQKALVGQEEDGRIVKGMKRHWYKAAKTFQADKERVYKIICAWKEWVGINC